MYRLVRYLQIVETRSGVAGYRMRAIFPYSECNNKKNTKEAVDGKHNATLPNQVMGMPTNQRPSPFLRN